MAGDDEDEGFGDFKFAPSNLNSNQTTAVVESDDDWGDFITTRSDQINVGFELSNGFSHTQSTPAPSLNQKPSDSFGNFVGNASVPSHVESVSSRAEPVKGTGSHWAKPRGALPLSLFGEIEEDEKYGLDGPKVGDSAFDLLNKKDDSTKKGLNSSVRVGIDDLIANLYNQSPQIKAPNGLNSPPDLNVLKSNMNGSSVNFDALNSFTNGLNLKQNGFDSNFRGVDLDVMKMDSALDGLNFTSNGSNSNSQQQSEDFDDDDGDDDGWEFRGAEPDKQTGNKVYEENGIVELPRLKVETNTRIDQEIQVDGNEKENAEESSKTIRFDNGANGAADKLTPSNGTSHPTGDWDFGFDLKPSSANQDKYFSNSFPRSDKNVTDFWSKISPAVNVDFSSYENFLQSKDVVLEAAAKPNSELGKTVPSQGLGGSTLDFRETYNPNDLFAALKGHAQKSGDWDFTFTFNSSSVAQDGTMSDPYSSNQKVDVAKGVGFFPDNKHDESYEDFGEFRDAFSETGSKHEVESMVAQSPANITSNAFDDQIQKNDLNFQKYQEALPLSIFGDEAQEANISSVHQDVPIDNPFAYSNNGIKGPITSISINDLISSLYSQTEQNASESSKPDTSENKTHSTTIKLESDPVNPDDDFGDESWEFKDAFASTVAQDKIPACHLEDPLKSESNYVNHDDDFGDESWEFKDACASTIAHDQLPVVHLEDPPRKSSNMLELNDFMDLFCKLKDESCFTALSHLENLKKAERSAAHSGDEAKAEGLNVEIQKFYDQLCEDNLIPGEFQPENHPSHRTCCEELLKVLQEAKFGVLESEYQLLGRLSLAEKDLRSAVELSKHAASTLRILKLGSMEQQSSYVSTWFKMVSICAQELKHGTFIWKQALQNNVQTEILSVSQGRQYFLSLGEIYRVVQVLGFSTEKYKPWVLLSSDGPTGLFSLLSECADLWSSSGLDGVLQSISDTTDCELSEKAKALLESMKFLDDLDPSALQIPILSGQAICQLSLLTIGDFPGMKTAVWNGEHYLLTLANLWANLIGSDPPDLPRLNLS